MNIVNKIFAMAFALAIGFSALSCVAEEEPVNQQNGSFNDISAEELVSQMTVGWNLGNTLDAHNGARESVNTPVRNIERRWVSHLTNRANIAALKSAGFNTIRIPVTWYKVCDDNYVIREDWMERVKEIVDYAVESDMYIILNTHHDNHIFKFMNAQAKESQKAFVKIWQQIADTFKWYNEKLVFEALNEPRTEGSAAQWNGGTSEERANLNDHYQIFVDTIRESGGYNKKRILMVNTYAASSGATAVNGLMLPSDTVLDKIIVSVHAYEPYNFALSTAENAVSTWNSATGGAVITQLIDRAYNAFVLSGYPVVIGEFGAMDRNNEAVRGEWAEFYVGYAKSKGIPCIWWDNHVFSGNGERFGLFDRTNNTITYPLVVEGLMRGAGVLVTNQ